MAINSSGDITLEGTLTAENYVVSSSVTNQTIAGVSGSTKFGDSLDDAHGITGSLNITGSGDEVFVVQARQGTVPRFRVDQDSDNTIGINCVPSEALVDIRSTGNDRHLLSFLNGSGTNIGGFYDGGGNLNLFIEDNSSNRNAQIEGSTGDFISNAGSFISKGVSGVISGSATSTGSFGMLHLKGPADDTDRLILLDDGSSYISGITKKAGSMGGLFVRGNGSSIGILTNGSYTTNPTGDTVALSVNSSTSAVTFPVANQLISGSSTSTGSFGNIQLGDVTGDAFGTNFYEEGEYTPTITPQGSGTITVDSSYDKLRYTRMGRVVHVQGNIIVGSVSSPTGIYVSISLPFTSANDGGDTSDRALGPVSYTHLTLPTN